MEHISPLLNGETQDKTVGMVTKIYSQKVKVDPVLH
jgi:hypothetical protein